MFSYKFLRLAYELAKVHPFDPSLEYCLCAVIVKGGKVLSVGFNSRGWNALSEHYRVKEHSCTLHAEVNAVMSKRKRVRFEGAKVYVVRLKSDGTVGNAKPCSMCQAILYNYGIKRAWFTTDEFPFVDCLKLTKNSQTC